MAVLERERLEATRTELEQLYSLLRTAALNVKYYGARAKRAKLWHLGLQIAAATGSFSAVGGFLTGDQFAGWGKFAWAGIAALSGALAAVSPLVGLSEKANRLGNLHFAYCELYHLCGLLLKDIRRAGVIADEHVGAAKVLYDLNSRLGPMDEEGPSRKLIKKFEAEVNEQIPSETLWMPQ